MDSKALASTCDIWPTLPRSSRLVYHPAKIGEHAPCVVPDHERCVYVSGLRSLCRQPLVRHSCPLGLIAILTRLKVSHIPTTALSVHRRPCRPTGHRTASSGLDLRHTQRPIAMDYRMVIRHLQSLPSLCRSLVYGSRYRAFCELFDLHLEGRRGTLRG